MTIGAHVLPSYQQIMLGHHTNRQCLALNATLALGSCMCKAISRQQRMEHAMNGLLCFQKKVLLKALHLCTTLHIASCLATILGDHTNNALSQLHGKESLASCLESFLTLCRVHLMRMSDCNVPHHTVDMQQNMSITDLLANADLHKPSQLLLQMPEEVMLTFLRRNMTSFSDTLVDLECADARVFCHVSTT